MPTNFRSMLGETNIGPTCAALIDRAKTYIEFQEDLATRTGRDLRDMHVDPADLPTWNLAERQSRVARAAGVIAAAVFAASGLLAAPLLALLPVVREQVLRALEPLSHSPNSLLVWVANQASALPLVGTMLWALIYAGWLQGVYVVVSSAHCGRSRWLVRVALGVLSLAFGVVGFEVLTRLDVPFLAALAPLALILAAWRLLAWATRQHALTAHRLNWIAAHREIAQEKRAAHRSSTTSTPHRGEGLPDLNVTPDNTNQVLDELESLLRARGHRLAAESLAQWPTEDIIELTITDPAGVFADQMTAWRWSNVLQRGRKLGIRAVVPYPVTLPDVHGVGDLRNLLSVSASPVLSTQS
ncbi:hypothetical protein [Kutzneria buriramensis]|uniref:Uncharacterized protein n=1 Tax=Kutzneria buriramensis TaxID=1045776 RepID=A0A3E0G867_9PSEU|nr:hypothetical protein [Kutzneria buriramensis]REH18264.1 hypothetical protein BCF44_13619 [Kutzneria buriramensis]